MVNFIPAQLPSLARSAAAQMCGEGRGQEGSACAGSAQACGAQGAPASVPTAPGCPAPAQQGERGRCPQGLWEPPAPALPAPGSGDGAPALGRGDQPYPGHTPSVWTLLAV